MLRCCTFSCSCTHTSCYAVEAADAADDDGGCDDDDEEEEEELVDETSVFFSFSIQQWRASQRPGTLFLMHMSRSFKWRKLLLSDRVRISA